jgi:ankyrin repeat protein
LFQLVKILVESGADVNPRREGDGWTPLHLASLFGKADVAQALLEAGARSSIKGSDGLTAEDVAKKYRHHALADILNR